MLIYSNKMLLASNRFYAYLFEKKSVWNENSDDKRKKGKDYQ